MVRPMDRENCPAHDTRCREGACIVDTIPAEVLERAERLGPADLRGTLQGRDIGWAVTEMRYHGGKVRRAGWNGKGMFLVFQKGYPDGIPINANTAQATGIAQGTVCRFLPYVMMHTADGSFVPWLCSQTDLLALDWELVT